MSRTALLVSLAALCSVCSPVWAATAESPPVQIVAPEAGCTAEVGDTLQVLVVVAPGLEVSTVVVMCDARGVGMADKPPYTFAWATADAGAGEHILRAFAYLRSGEKVGAEPVMVSLYLPQPTPGPPTLSSQHPSALPPVVLKEGTPILLQTTEKMVSGRVAEGSTVRYKVARDVVSPEGKVLIAYGGFAQGKVTRSRSRGMFGKAGQLEFTVDSLDAVDGTVVPLRAHQEVGGKGNKNEVIISTLFLTVFAVFVHGRDVEVASGAELTAYVDHDTVIQRPQAPPAEGMARGEPLETVSISEPSAGKHVRVGDSLTISVSAEPSQKFRVLTLFANGKQIGAAQGTLEPFVWSTRRVPPGEYALEAEVQFTNGRVVRSGPVSVAVVAE